MGLRDFLGIAKKDKNSGIQSTETPILTLLNATQFLSDAESCLNPKDGPEFVAGMRAAFIPLKQSVFDKLGKETEYGDTLQEYAMMTRDDAESKLKIFQTLASQMKHAPACGVKFVMADLILAYARVGVYPQGSIQSLIKLQEISLAILEEGARYG
jgi:hypothetical protein